MTGSQVAKRFGVSTKSVTNDWAKDGCPRNADKSFDLEKVVAWRKAKLQAAADDPAVKMQASKTALQAKRLMLQCEKLEIEVLRERGKLHDKDACATSLTEIRARESHILHGLWERFSSAFPEQIQQAQWLEREVDEVIGRLHDTGGA